MEFGFCVFWGAGIGVILSLVQVQEQEIYSYLQTGFRSSPGELRTTSVAADT